MKPNIISFRIAPALLALVDAEALRQRRSRNQTLILILERWSDGAAKDDDVRGTGSSSEGEVGGSGNAIVVPDVSKAKVRANRLREVQPLRTELATGGGSHPAPTPQPCKQHTGKVFRAGDGWTCLECNRK